jgi:hypothetical protein
VESSRHLPLKELAVKADQLWLTLAAKQQQLAVVAAAVKEQQAEEAAGGLVVAVKGKHCQKFKGKKQFKGDGQQGQQTAKQDGAGHGKGQKLVKLQLCWRRAMPVLGQTRTIVQIKWLGSGQETRRPVCGSGPWHQGPVCIC